MSHYPAIQAQSTHPSANGAPHHSLGRSPRSRPPKTQGL